MATLRLTRPRSFRMTVREFDRLTNLGFFEDRRVELIEGRMIEMPPQREPHGVGVILAGQAMAQAFGPGYTVRPQLPLRLGTFSKPEPDIAVVAGNARDTLRTGTPRTALLIIEVSERTLAYDRGRKASLYARFGIADYWIMNLVNRRLEVHRNPIADAAHRFGFRYSHIEFRANSDSVFPLAMPRAEIKVADLLP